MQSIKTPGNRMFLIYHAVFFSALLLSIWAVKRKTVFEHAHTRTAQIQIYTAQAQSFIRDFALHLYCDSTSGHRSPDARRHIFAWHGPFYNKDSLSICGCRTRSLLIASVKRYQIYTPSTLLLLIPGICGITELRDESFL